MKSSVLLERMCHEVLGNGDLKAIVKSRGFPAMAVQPGIMTGLFLTEQGLDQAFQALTRDEIAAIHLLKSVDEPVSIEFFERVYPSTASRYGTITQRYQGCLAKVKERFVRTGILLMSDVKSRDGEAKMELWRFALPAEFHRHVPPLFTAPRSFDGQSDTRPNAVREQLIADLRVGSCASTTPTKSTKSEERPRFQITSGELHLGPSLFATHRIVEPQVAIWSMQLASPKKRELGGVEKCLSPPEAALQLLGSLGDHQWVEPEAITELLSVFSGSKVDAHPVCDAGWQVGVLAKHEADGKTWYRLASDGPRPAPHAYLNVLDENAGVVVDLALVPFDALATLRHLGDVRVHASSSGALLLTPSFQRIARADHDALASDLATWLFQHAACFQQVHQLFLERRGKTVLHQNLMIARVTDLSLRIALEKSLGERWISLKNDFVVFPREALGDVQRLVKKLGHVIKEVSKDGC